MIKAILSAGASLRSTARPIYSASANLIDEIQIAAQAEHLRAQDLLQNFDRSRIQVSKSAIRENKLYQLANITNVSLVDIGEENLLKAPVFDKSVLPVLPGLFLPLIFGILCGTLLGFVLGYFFASAPYMWAAFLLPPAIFGAMIGSASHAKNFLEIANKYELQSRIWKDQLASYLEQVRKLENAVTLSSKLIADLQSKLDAKEAELESIAFDTTNAAVLLKDVLNTALLNEEGAFLQEVIDKLHGQQKRIKSFAQEIDCKPE